MADLSHIYGACACERNKYNIAIPAEAASLIQVFWDNTAYSRRVQAAPTTAWLRVPLDWFSSQTESYYPDESHSSIKRTFHTPSADPNSPPTRRQFCGYCGSHLTQWNEAVHHDYTSTNSDGYLDVTLGSLFSESVDRLEALKILSDPDTDEESVVSGEDSGTIAGGFLNNEDHIPTNESSVGVVDAPRRVLRSTQPHQTVLRAINQPPHNVQNRGLPYFENMIQNSRLGRIRHRTGGYTSGDGTKTVRWEVTEIGGRDGEPMPDVPGGQLNKRAKLDL
ncbi:hypothetical protein DOTSEDRAFT_70635 [Dothistroma septosporum NZE10]|uniref:CENP-V/GFA domain-containing protein n=1 Tax=Dothistroma septosporum (strain NZE10 / CBS 128990) TaxID=675120 RepID=N1PTA1_DOTSN|nr:hypothetical protein DOTSEDRAFT_70635 [Dothistroma septosporum NZE10]